MILFCAIITIVEFAIIGGIFYAVYLADKRELICKTCKRTLLIENWETSNGCRWCDNDYWDEQQKKEK